MNEIERARAIKGWQNKVTALKPSACSGHEFIPVSWSLTEKAKHVTVLMCTKCFHEINVSDIYANRKMD